MTLETSPAPPIPIRAVGRRACPRSRRSCGRVERELFCLVSRDSVASLPLTSTTLAGSLGSEVCLVLATLRRGNRTAAPTLLLIWVCYPEPRAHSLSGSTTITG